MTPEEVVVNYEKKHHSFVDLTGRTFGRLTAICPVKIEGHRTIRWLCRCYCDSAGSCRVGEGNRRSRKIRLGKAESSHSKLLCAGYRRLPFLLIASMTPTATPVEQPAAKPKPTATPKAVTTPSSTPRSPPLYKTYEHPSYVTNCARYSSTIPIRLCH
jgi:hypothetical protein